MLQLREVSSSVYALVIIIVDSVLFRKAIALVLWLIVLQRRDMASREMLASPNSVMIILN